MDAASRNALSLLRCLGQAEERFWEFAADCARRGASPGRPTLLVHPFATEKIEGGTSRMYAGYIAVCLNVVGRRGGEYEFSLEVWWTVETWLVRALAGVWMAAGGLRSLGEWQRVSPELDGCLELIRAGAEEVVRWGSLVPGSE